jgi:hypothetical protein
VPADRAREERRLLEELLDVVFAKVRVCGVWGLVQGEDVVCGLEFGDGNEADLEVDVSRCAMWWEIFWGLHAFLLLLFADLMRDAIPDRFSASCFARWGFICMSSAIMVMVALCREGRSSRRQFRGDASANSVSPTTA